MLWYELVYLLLALFLLAWFTIGRRVIKEGVRAAASPVIYFVSLITVMGGVASVWELVSSSDEKAGWVSLLIFGVGMLLCLSLELRGLLHRTVVLEEVRLSTVDAKSATGLRICHLSDLHLTSQRSLETGASSEVVIDRARRAIAWGLKSAEMVCITGDITDQGTEQEWAMFSQLLSELSRDDRLRVVPLPGNHDITLATSLLGTGEPEIEHELRCHRFLESCFELCPDTWVLCNTKRTSVKGLLAACSTYRTAYKANPPRGKLVAHSHANYLKLEVPTELRIMAASAGSRYWPTATKLLYSDLFQLLYPLIVLETDSVVIVALNSASPVGGTMWSSSFGLIGGDQLHKLQGIVATVGSRQLILLVHHHIGFPSQIRSRFCKSHSWMEAKLLQLRDAKAFLSVISPCKRRPIVFHGHKHIAYVGERPESLCVSAPSVATGDCLGDPKHAGSVYSISSSGEVALVDSLFL